MSKKEVRIGVVGIGNMGSSHADNLFSGKVKNAVLTAVCDVKESRLSWAKDTFSEDVKRFNSYEAMLKSDEIDAVIVATPHYDHPDMAIKGLEADKHVLIEKPAGVYTKAVGKMNKTASASDKIFTIMYNQRTNPLYQKVKELIDTGEIGEIIRINWVISDWYRSQTYYNSGGWRATWKGEGGGVLLNQCPHQLDLLQWICGMPKRVRAFLDYGKFHDIEVEDDVTAFMEYDNGATGVFITSTGEAPGTNRLEISGDRGKLTVENDKITFIRNRYSLKEYTATTDKAFEKPENWQCEIPVEGEAGGHVGIIQSFVDCILNGKKQLSPGADGINGLMLSNAMHMSSWKDEWVVLPVDGDQYYDLLQEKIKSSTFEKQSSDIVLDVRGSH